MTATRKLDLKGAAAMRDGGRLVARAAALVFLRNARREMDEGRDVGDINAPVWAPVERDG